MFSSIYMHFPFCESKCHYCDFYSIGREKTTERDVSSFEEAITREIQIRGESGVIAPVLNTIFLGGGTPSMTSPDSMSRIFNELFKHTSLKPNDETEWTMEANPSSIELSKLKKYRALGINRVSMGVQSLKNEHLAILGRVHDESQALESLQTVFEAGFTNVSTDLLCGVPGQTLDDLRAHMDKLTSFPITHLSIYLLTLAPHHKMFKDLPNEEEQLKHLLLIDEYMREKNFRHYEISNFAKNNLRARHNLVYWEGGSYLSFGPSAHSFSAPEHKRFKNYSSLHQYAKTLINEGKLPVEWEELLSPSQLDLEKWLLAIRLDEGFPSEWLLTDAQRKKAEMLLREGLLEIHPERQNFLRATPQGFALSDSVVKTLI